MSSFESKSSPKPIQLTAQEALAFRLKNWDYTKETLNAFEKRMPIEIVTELAAAELKMNVLPIKIDRLPVGIGMFPPSMFKVGGEGLDKKWALGKVNDLPQHNRC